MHMVAKDFLRQMAYGSGLMGLVHRIRNRHTLTVFMFHRVLPHDSLAYRHAEKEFTFTIEGFESALDFIAEHYNVVDHDWVRSAVEGRRSLPARAALITFDDGWRDTLLHARKPLAKRRMTAVLFVATEAPTLAPDRWWQDQVVEARGDDAKWARLTQAMGASALASQSPGEAARHVTVALSRQRDAERHRTLDDIAQAEPMPRQMLTEDELLQLPPTIAVAGHGHTHAPLRGHPDAKAELEASHRQLLKWGGDSWSMSFPHGSYDEHSLDLAHRAGFALCFTSDPVLMRTRAQHRLNRKIGRVHVPENEWTCRHGRISHAKLATFLFLREKVS